MSNIRGIFLFLLLLCIMAGCVRMTELAPDDTAEERADNTPIPTPRASPDLPTDENTPISPETPAAESSPSPAAPPSASPPPAEPSPAPSGVPGEQTLHYADLNGVMFHFSSGVGAWSTGVSIRPDGSFEGSYSDADMGDAGTDYPNGTVYHCVFKGKFSPLARVDEHSYSMLCEYIAAETEEGTEEIIDGVRYIASAPYGFDDAGAFMLYLPGKATADLPEAFLDWVSMPTGKDMREEETLDFYGLYNIEGEQGFFGY